MEYSLSKLKELDLPNNHSKSLDYLYNYFDDLLLNSKYVEANSEIGIFLEMDFSLQIQVGLLLGTLPFKSYLPNRQKVYDKAYSIANREFNETQMYTLFTGLE